MTGGNFQGQNGDETRQLPVGSDRFAKGDPMSTSGQDCGEPSRRSARFSSREGFTLIELMVVICIMGIIMAIGIPFAYRTMHKETLTTTVSDVQTVCSHARARAILHGHMTEVLFYPKEGRLQVDDHEPASPTEDGAVSAATGAVPSGSGLSAQIPSELTIDMLDINLTEYKDADVARVRFYPNGTCDEMTLIIDSENRHFREIALEITTGLADVKSAESRAELESKFK